MSKNEFSNEYEIKASSKLIYPYLSTASGLERWFADKVTVDNNAFKFTWEDGESQSYKMVSKKKDKFFKLQLNNPEDTDGFIEFKLEMSGLTKFSYLTVIDHSSEETLEELEELWEDVIYSLKEIVGG